MKSEDTGWEHSTQRNRGGPDDMVGGSGRGAISVKHDDDDVVFVHALDVTRRSSRAP